MQGKDVSDSSALQEEDARMGEGLEGNLIHLIVRSQVR